MSFLRIDRKFLKGSTTVTKTDEGYLSVTAPIARTGVYKYVQPDGTIQREYIPPTTLFSQDSIETLQLKPVTNNHPFNFVNTDSYQDLSVGSVGETIVQEGDKLVAKFMITSQDAIDAVNEGRLQLSPAYSCGLDFTSGVTDDGEHYDAIQIDRKYNHLAIVDKARGGDELNFKMDGDLDIGVETNKNYNLIERDSMKKTIRIDSVDHEVGDEVASHISALSVRADNAEDSLVAKEAEVSTLQAKLDSAEEEVEQLTLKLDSTDKIDERVDAKINLITTAMSVLGEDGFKKSDSDEDIKKAVVLKVYPKAEPKLDSCDDAYLNARFDSAVESFEDQGIAQQRADMDEPSDPKPKASKERVDSLQNRWKASN